MRWDTRLIREDIAERGWMASDLAQAANLTPATVSLFLRGRIQTAKTAAAMARALGYRTPRRYLRRAARP